MLNVKIALTLSCLLALTAGCGTRKHTEKDGSQATQPTPMGGTPAPSASQSNELVGTWVSPCFRFIGDRYAQVTYIIGLNNSFDLLEQSFSDSACRVQASSKFGQGVVSYGQLVGTSTDVKAIDIILEDQETTRGIYQVQTGGGTLCFGDQSSPSVNGRPSEITCAKPFTRL